VLLRLIDYQASTARHGTASAPQGARTAGDGMCRPGSRRAWAWARFGRDGLGPERPATGPSRASAVAPGRFSA
jgi:hypothetical protein